MKNAVIVDLQDYFRRHGKLVLLAIVTAFLSFGFLVFSDSIRIDTEELINTPGTTLGWLTIGRYGLVFLKRLLGLSTHHVFFSGILFFAFFTAGANLIAFLFYHFSGKDERYPYWVFIVLYCTSNIWCYQIYFSLQQAEVACAMFLIVLAALLSMRACFITFPKGSFLRLLLSGVCLVIGFGVYQALVTYYIAVCIAVFLVLLWRQYEGDASFPAVEDGRKKENRHVLRGIVILMFHFAVSYGIYSGIAHTWFMAAGNYLTDQKGWGRISTLQCLKNIIKTVARVVFWRGSEYFSFYTVGAVLSLFAVAVIFRKFWREDKLRCILYAAAMLGLLISPFLMTIYMGEFLVIRTQFALPVAAAFLGMYGVGRMPQKRKSGKIGSVCSLLVFVTMLVQAGFCLQLAYTDQVRCEKDAALTEEITAQLENVCGGELPQKPVIFVGAYECEPEFGTTKTEMYGWSFYEWDCSKENPTGATHRIAGFIRAYSGIALNEESTEKMRREAAALSGEMADFPAEDSIRQTEDFVVVRLSGEAELLR